MKAAPKAMQAFLTRACAGLDTGNARTFEAPGYMRLVCENIGGHLFSLAHYGEQNGDPMRDPEIVFYRGADLMFYPVSFRNDYAGIDQECARVSGGFVTHVAARSQREVATFCGQWARNIKAQGFTVVARGTVRAIPELPEGVS